MVETLLYQQTDDPVGVEDEVSAVGILITDNARSCSLESHCFMMLLTARERTPLTRAAQLAGGSEEER